MHGRLVPCIRFMQNTKKQTKQKSLSRWLSLVFVLMMAVGLMTVGVVSYFLNRSSSIEMNSERALGIARTVAAAVDADEFEKIVATGEKTPYWYDYKAFLDDVINKNGLVYLYVLSGYDADEVTYFAEGLLADDDIDSLDLGETEALDEYDEHLPDVFAGAELYSDTIYTSEDWGSLVSGMAPIINDDGRVVGIVGADIGIDDMLDDVNRFGALLLAIDLVLWAGIGAFILLYLRRRLGRPIAELNDAAQRIARGETNLQITTHANDEIGALADSFRGMIETIKGQAETLKALSDGDLTIDIAPQSGEDTISHAFIDTLDKLNELLTQIGEVTGQVAEESAHIAASSQALAKGSASQAAAVDELSATVGQISTQTTQNADMAAKSAKLAGTVRVETTNSYNQMEQLIAAVHDISEASSAIRSVLKTINDIAVQTNILSLNASVEAARAGEYGAGFAVVAKEVQDLSKKTSESAKETAQLLADSIAKTQQGVQLAGEVHVAMTKVISTIAESDRIANDIAMSSREQMSAISQINIGIDQVAQVVYQNNAAAEQSAAVSQKLSEQAVNLTALIARFRTRVR